MRRITAIVAAIAAVFAVTAVAGAASSQESAQGNYEQFNGFYAVSFSAKATLENTNASGHLTWTNQSTDPNTVLQADVTCLTVGPARTATIGGTVTSFTGPQSFPGVHGVFIQVTDNGQGPTQLLPDTATPPLTNATAPTADTCVPPFVVSQSPITSGDITVKPVKTGL
ncbi:MAG: hypothetical protein ACJ74M_10935 [Gaiellaceae bacterium]|jgi:hypothetical protein